MANMNASLEQIYSTEIMDVPVGLGGMILAGNMISGVVAQILKKIEVPLNLTPEKNPMGSMAVRTIGTAGAAWVMAKYANEIIGAKTAKLASAVIVANGASEIIGGMLPVNKKTGRKDSLVDRMNDLVANLAPSIESSEKDITALETAAQEYMAKLTKTDAGATGYLGAKDPATGALAIDPRTNVAFAGYTDYGYIPPMPAFPTRREEKVRMEEMIG